MPIFARFLGAVVTATALAIIPAAGNAQAPDVPADLRPMLTARQSEMRLVTNRYNADRTLLVGNYAGSGGGGRGGGGRGGDPGRAGGAGAGNPAAPPPPIVISAHRIARLERFDLSWQAALQQLSITATLTPQARTDLTALQASVAANLKELDAQAAALAEVTPLLPFSPELIQLIEDRINIKDLDAAKAAGTIVQVTREVTEMQGRLRAGAVRANRIQALGAADATDQFRAGLANWNTFYDGYDPLYTWWMRMPYKQVDAALRAYATFLRDTTAAASQTSTLTVGSPRIAPAPAPRYAEVPNLREILVLPQDEMTDIVQRYRGGGGGGGGGRGAGGGGAATRDSGYYNAWLASLRTLDFDKLTRNAQVDYLWIKKRAEVELSRVGKPLPPAASNPRKADSSEIPGPARGREGLIRDLQDELIPYTPEQLIVLAEREFAWCEAEMKKASRLMGLGDDWKKALEKTKTMYVPPGGQPAMIRDLLTEAVAYLRLRDLLTIPQVETESQHMIMMTPERQLVNPFFTGGGQMSLSFPTDGMDYDARMQSMRGNNRPWSHATAFHEMIPGHNMTAYMSQRFSGYRPSLGGGPFYNEGWAVYWELTMYEMGFHDTPEERVGALFWRMHRCARIIFSLRFHMGQWSPQEAIDFLVDRVGHERDNATAEVRRSFDPSAGYGPLYQAGYLLGALQLRSLRKDLVDTRVMTNKSFHDEILRLGSQPIDVLRLTLSKQKLTRDMSIDWKFYGELPEK